MRDHREDAGGDRGTPPPKVRDHREGADDDRGRRGRSRRDRERRTVRARRGRRARSRRDRERRNGRRRRDRRAEPSGVEPDQAVRAAVDRIREVFDDPDDDAEFLAFPVTATGLPELGSAAFADLVNRIPDAGAAWRPRDRRVSTVYREVLTDAVVADIKRSDAERDALAEARALLFTTAEDGSEQPSEALRTYRELRDEHERARLRLAELEANDEVDPEEVEVARTAAEDARSAWVSRGRKGDVEDAQSTIDRLEGQRPILAWNDAKSALEQHERIDADSGGSYHETVTDLGSLADANWTVIDLDTDEIEERAERVSDDEELAACVPLPTPNAEEVTALGAEAALLRIHRPWFRPGLLANRSWRFATDREPLSDGGDPPQGRLPAYAIGIVVVRDPAMTPAGEDEPQTIAEEPYAAALLCRRMPQAPDPDPGMDWSG